MADFYNLDFDEIKDSIRSYMQTNATLLADYNFEGSGISSLLNVMAFITQYQMFYLNMVSKELYINSAQIADNVYKIAHMLNYIPKRNVSPSIEVVVTNSSSTLSYSIAQGTTIAYNETILTYVDSTSTTIGSSTSATITMYEGSWISETFISDGSAFQTYALPDQSEVDDNYLFVYVGSTLWNNINSESPVAGGNYYYIDYLTNFSIKFDNGILYNKPTLGATISVKYLKTVGAEANGSIPAGTTLATSGNLTYVASSNLSNGENAETLEEIKSRAVLMYSTQQRAITESDYNAIFTRYPGYANFAGAQIWGGEKEWIDPLTGYRVEYSGTAIPDKGYIYVTALKSIEDNLYEFEFLDGADETAIESFFEPYKILTLFFKFATPRIVYIEPQVSIKPKSYISLDTASLSTTIDTYFQDNYKGFDVSIYKSNVLRWIDSLNEVNYSNFDYSTYVQIYKDGDVYTTANLCNTVTEDSIAGAVFEVDSSAVTLSYGTLLIGVSGTATVIDSNSHISGTGTISVTYSGTFSVSDTITIQYTDASTASSTINAIEVFSSTNGSIYLDSTTIGTITSTSGWMVFDSMTGTALENMTSFAFYFDYDDKLAITVERDTFICPRAATVTLL